jgi:hypothetical protein
VATYAYTLDLLKADYVATLYAAIYAANLDLLKAFSVAYLYAMTSA